MFENEDAKIGDGEDSPDEQSEHEELQTKFKPVAGVKFVEYDEFGLKTTEDQEFKKYIKTDDLVGATVLQAPEEQMLRIMNPTGVREDTDIEVKDMNEECK